MLLIGRHDDAHRVPEPECGALATGRDSLERPDHLDESVINRFTKYSALIREVIIDCCPVNSSHVGDRSDRGSTKAIPLKDRSGRLQDLFTLGAVLGPILLLGRTPLHCQRWWPLTCLRHTIHPGRRLPRGVRHSATIHGWSRDATRIYELDT